MKQLFQSVRTGTISVVDVPSPLPGQGELLVSSRASLISTGTERYVVDLARQTVLGKVRSRPDHVLRILRKMRREGVSSTLTQVKAKLEEPMPLGYSLAGVVRACGGNVQDFKVGDRVAAASPHTTVAAVGQKLCARIPEGVTYEQASYAGVAAVAMQGLRLAHVEIGERVLVIGLGLIGQIAVLLLRAQGCHVLGLDVDPVKLEMAKALIGLAGVADVKDQDGIDRFAGRQGVDAVIIAAATRSNRPVEIAADACRPKGRIVLVGVTGLELPRPPFFKKELEFTVSSSLGPGRGDPTYEEKGVDYPIGYARWTAQRNMEAVLDLIASGKLPVERLTTHRFPIERAPEAYDLLSRRIEPYNGIVLEYGVDELRDRITRIELQGAPRRVAAREGIRDGIGHHGISVVGAGNFARLVLLPLVAKHQPAVLLRGICTGKGLNAAHTGHQYSFAFATTDANQILEDVSTSAVFVATRHNLHADFVISCLRAGKHTFVEKPLCITFNELERIAACVKELGSECPLLMVGFNRRFAPGTKALREHFAGIEPLSVSYRFVTEDLTPDRWPQDPEIGGGRIVGEACHAIDTCAAIVESPPARVYAESVSKVGGIETTDDRVFITLRHANGSVSNIAYQAGGDRGGPSERIEVFGGGRTAIAEEWDRIELWARNRRSRVRGRKDKGHGAEVRAFLDACRVGGPCPIAWEDVYATTWASLAAVESLRSGLPVNIDEHHETQVFR